MTGLLTSPRLVSADDVCTAVEATLVNHLPGLFATLGVSEDYDAAISWQQVPDLDALTQANLPAGAITSPGLTGPPTRSGDGTYTAVWRVGVGIYVRGEDHRQTQQRARDWCAFIRAVLLSNRTLGGFATSLTWVGEEYARARLKSQARTLAGGSVAVDVKVANVVDLTTAGPTVTSTSLTVQAGPSPAALEEN